MIKAFVLMRMIGGQPNIDFKETPIHGRAHIPTNLPGDWGAFLVSGSGAQLLDLQDLSNVIGIVAVTEDENTHWGELDGLVDSGIMIKLNNWIGNNHPSWPRVKAVHTYRKIIKELFSRLNINFKLSTIDVGG